VCGVGSMHYAEFGGKIEGVWDWESLSGYSPGCGLGAKLP